MKTNATLKLHFTESPSSFGSSFCIVILICLEAYKQNSGITIPFYTEPKLYGQDPYCDSVNTLEKKTWLQGARLSPGWLLEINHLRQNCQEGYWKLTRLFSLMRRDKSLLGQKMSLAKICSIDKFKSAENIFVLLVKTHNYSFLVKYWQKISSTFCTAWKRLDFWHSLRLFLENLGKLMQNSHESSNFHIKCEDI